LREHLEALGAVMTHPSRSVRGRALLTMRHALNFQLQAAQQG
jgi:hypothetical protein